MMRLVFLARAAMAAALLIGASAVHAQDNATVGSPLLRDFELKGTRTTPPAQQPAPTPAPTPPAAAPRAAETPTARPAGERPAARPAVQRPQTAAPVQSTAVPDPSTGQGVPDAGPQPDLGAGTPLLELETTEALPVETLPSANPLTPPSPQEIGGANWTWAVAAGAGLVLLLGFVLFRRRRLAMADAGTSETFAEPVPAPAPRVPAAPPAPAQTAPAGSLQVDFRPWLDIEFRPEKMVATDTEATVHFELIVLNRGRSPARNVRILAKMFNPSANQKQEITAFFAQSVNPSAQPIGVPSQVAARFNTKVSMPRDNIREVQVQGRSIFVPTVAVNIIYDYGNGRTGQTSNCYLVGTETQASEKMGPFRLDLGPRIYRQVGGRSLDLARAL